MLFSQDNEGEFITGIEDTSSLGSVAELVDTESQNDRGGQGQPWASTSRNAGLLAVLKKTRRIPRKPQDTWITCQDLKKESTVAAAAAHPLALAVSVKEEPPEPEPSEHEDLPKQGAKPVAKDIIHQLDLVKCEPDDEVDEFDVDEASVEPVACKIEPPPALEEATEVNLGDDLRLAVPPLAERPPSVYKKIGTAIENVLRIKFEADPPFAQTITDGCQIRSSNSPFEEAATMEPLSHEATLAKGIKEELTIVDFATVVEESMEDLGASVAGNVLPFVEDSGEDQTIFTLAEEAAKDGPVVAVVADTSEKHVNFGTVEMTATEEEEPTASAALVETIHEGSRTTGFEEAVEHDEFEPRQLIVSPPRTIQSSRNQTLNSKQHKNITAKLGQKHRPDTALASSHSTGNPSSALTASYSSSITAKRFSTQTASHSTGNESSAPCHNTANRSSAQTPSHSTANRSSAQTPSHSTADTSSAQTPSHSTADTSSAQTPSHSTTNRSSAQTRSHSTANRSSAQTASHSTANRSSAQTPSHSTANRSSTQTPRRSRHITANTSSEDQTPLHSVPSDRDSSQCIVISIRKV